MSAGQARAGPAPCAILTRQRAYATVAVGFDWEVSRMAKSSIGRVRSATPVDAHIGQKIRTRRTLLGLSQTELADVAGITFQQVQKYEKGTNRVGASRLQQFSQALGVPPSYFFDGLPTVGKKLSVPQEGELSEGSIVSFLGTREGAELVRGFLAIKDKSIRQNLIGLINTIKGR
jgi:transcriptional regulator with XRE-family HTH domain